MFFRKLINKRVYGYTTLEYTLFFAALTLLLGHNLNSQAIILFCIAGAFANSLDDKRRRLSKSFLWILPVLLFFAFLASLIWDPNGMKSLTSIEKKSSFLVLPIIMASLPPFSKKTVKTTFLVFILSVLVVCSFCLGQSAQEYFLTKDYRVFFYHYLSEQMNLNAIYLSLYCTFCLCILLCYYFIHPDPFRFLSRPLSILLYLVFVTFVILLSSKMMIFISVALTLASILFVAYRKNKLIKGILLILFIAVAGGMVVWNTHYLRWRVEVTLLKKYDNENDDQNGLAVRQKLWETSTRLISQRPLLGYGVGHANEKLIEEFYKENFLIAADNKYNSHNAYLQTLLNAGIIAFLPLVALLIISTGLAIQRKSYLFITFLFMIITLGLTEALFEAQKGIVFFVLFLFLFLYHFEMPTDLSNSRG